MSVERSTCSALPLFIAGTLLGCVVGLLPTQKAVGDDEPFWKQFLDRRIERIRSGEVKPVLLHRQQSRSLDYALFAPSSASGVNQRATAVPPVDAAEIARFVSLRERFPSEAFEYLDEFFLERDDLKALAVRDSDGDGITDYTVSDYFGKFMEGDIDIDGDGVRNTLDIEPYDAARGRAAVDPEQMSSATVTGDGNGNGVPDHVDLAFRTDSKEIATIQSALLADHGILLVERNSRIDLPLARAVDDAVRRVYRAYFEHSPVMPTLRTLAVERTALLGPIAKAYVGDHTNAQTFAHTQSLTLYDEGREVDHDIGLLGLIVHEMGHSYHMALDFDARNLAAENARTDYPAPNFVALIEPFGWVRSGYYDGQFEDSLPVMPRFAYIGTAEPLFEYRGRTPEEWQEWLLAQYEALDEDPAYLEHAAFASRYIIGDYSLSSPYEWFADHLIAYVITVLERHALARLEADGQSEKIQAARAKIAAAVREIWPDFYHRNIAPELLAFFERTFPITPEDREFLTRRYIDPILGSTPTP